jgi:hypothetical protein
VAPRTQLLLRRLPADEAGDVNPMVIAYDAGGDASTAGGAIVRSTPTETGTEIVGGFRTAVDLSVCT